MACRGGATLFLLYSIPAKTPVPLNYREKGHFQLHTRCGRFLSHPAFLPSLVSVSLLLWRCQNSPAASMQPPGPAKDWERFPLHVPLVSGCSECHRCSASWPPRTETSSLAREGLVLLPSERVYLWRRGTGGQSLNQQSLRFMTGKTRLSSHPLSPVEIARRAVISRQHISLDKLKE